MDQQEITSIIRSTVHIVMSDPKTLAPMGIGSGCVVNFQNNEILLTVAHVTNKDNSATCIVTGQPTVNNMTPMYSVGAMTYLDKFNITKYEEQLQILQNEPDRIEDIDFGLIDFSFASLQDKVELLQQQIKFKEFTVPSSDKSIIKTELEYEPNTETEYCFFGRIKPNYFKGTPMGDIFETQEVVYGGLRFNRKVGNYYEFELPNEIKDHADFQGTSGAPIMDSKGNIVSLVTHGYTGAKNIYGIALADFKSGVEAMILTDEMNNKK
ncbi:hypothetical protein ACJD0Z_06855 [Flavobacteriaceae bacterium M23B6Z8]